MKDFLHILKTWNKSFFMRSVYMAVDRNLEEMATYITKTTRSYQEMQDAMTVMPGGVTANIKSFDPYPVVMEKGSGAYLTDVDGNVYVDYLLAYGAMMLGHNHEAIKQAIINQWDSDGTCLFGTPHKLETTTGKRIQQYYPSMDLLRYTNSGTEATLLALRLACAYTGKHKIAKFEGHYHGGYDQVLFSINPALTKSGPIDAPFTVEESKGIDPYLQKQTIILPFNDIKTCEKLLKQHANDLAAVIIEPLQGGFIRAKQNFIEQLRALTTELGIVLIFDEVKTGFRTALGGAQQFYQITPDLTTLGKVIGGGYPIGIVGGKRDIMMESAPMASADVFESSRHSKANEILFHSGTYNGHPTILAAANAVIDVLEQEFSTVLNRTQQLKKELQQLCMKKQLPMKAIGEGTIFNIVFSHKEILNYRDLSQSDLTTRKRLDYLLLSEGIYTKPLNRYSMSTQHLDFEIEKTIEAFHRVITKHF
jgi:glutamate-1-semialdehyde 2,1-aminomutase